MKSFVEYLQEKQIVYSNNAKYGQIVFFAGGAGSGKGFSISHFINHALFKIRDVDSIKLLAMKMPEMLKKYPEIKDFNLRNAEDVSSIHQIVKKEKIPEKQMDMLLTYGMKNKDTLPNLLFDTTLKDIEELDKYVPAFLAAGYKPENIHITWVLTNIEVAIKQNSQRNRVVSPEIINLTHNGVALTMKTLLNGKLPHGMNGSFTVILNNAEEVKWYDYSNKPHIEKAHRVAQDFTYLQLKKAGQSMPSFEEMDYKIRDTLTKWVLSNAPKTQQVQQTWEK